MDITATLMIQNSNHHLEDLDSLVKHSQHENFLNVVYLIHFIFVENKQQTLQPKTQTLLPKFQKIFEQMCENIKMDRRRRSLTTIQVADRHGIESSCTIPH